MATKASTPAPDPTAPPVHPRAGGRWIRAADGTLSREVVTDNSTAPDDAAPATEEAR